VPTLHFYSFRYRDQHTGKWIRARYLAKVPVIQRQYAEWELTGPPEIREAPDNPSLDYFDPFRSR